MVNKPPLMSNVASRNLPKSRLTRSAKRKRRPQRRQQMKKSNAKPMKIKSAAIVSKLMRMLRAKVKKKLPANAKRQRKLKEQNSRLLAKMPSSRMRRKNKMLARCKSLRAISKLRREANTVHSTKRLASSWLIMTMCSPQKRRLLTKRNQAPRSKWAVLAKRRRVKAKRRTTHTPKIIPKRSGACQRCSRATPAVVSTIRTWSS